VGGRGRAAALRSGVRLLGQAVGAWWRDDGLRLGAALSYYTAFSLAPVLILSVAVAGLVFGTEAATGRIIAELRGLMGPQGASAIQSLIQSAAVKPGAGIGATVFGFATILFGASGAFGELQKALNDIWKAESAAKNGSWRHVLRTRLASFSMVLVIGFLLLVSLVISAGLAALDDIVGNLGRLQPLIALGNLVISYAVITLLFALIFRVLPDTHVPWRHIWPGAAVAAGLFVLGKFAIGFYIGNTAVASVYGAASSLAVLLLWVYYSSQTLFIGAELSQVLCERREATA
jgi:membrane protein